ncbi:lycopene beta-cyclase CrtY, partial [Phenylobacterium sp.]|uniref:lycopene beta-cyclase CrtY n=1 Tax=Phenylobacterium sp. TaxID=1871053 RepID=UPI002E32A68A
MRLHDASVQADVALIGGGLASSLIALKLADLRPDLSVHILERLSGPDDSHTWCLFETDVTPEQWRWLTPLFERVWDGYEVVFPDHRRRLTTRYACISSRSLGRAVKATLGDRVHRGAAVVDFGRSAVLCEDGLSVNAPLVIDARGPRASSALKYAYQKFVGLEVRLRQPHGLAEPVVMDGGVRQADGFRFLYLLPLGPDRLLIEDTRYSDTARLDAPALEREIDRYARASGWQVAEVIRREGGVLPVALGGDIEAYWRELGGTACVGLRGAFFHPTTGYSLPEAVRTAGLVASAPELTTAALAERLKAESIDLWRRGGFSRALNRMMFL